ncbi:MAG: tRNA 2-selenouridine(34) synthase MnmH [Ferruginibacter sp.]
MAVQRIELAAFLHLTTTHPVFDVRSPGEYNHAHIPGAYSLPLFTDEQRKVVGTTYKQQSREHAIKIGLDYFGPNMKTVVETAETLIATFYNGGIKPKTVLHEHIAGKTILVHCWRGGMRSAAIAWLLDLYGFKVYTLVGGYKVYRQWVLAQFAKSYPVKVLGGYTGSGKTLVLQALQENTIPVIDLEKMACHKGSAFGALGENTQPSQEMFENTLATTLDHLLQENVSEFFIEDESQRIGTINIPAAFWKQMREAPLYFLDIPFEARLNYLTQSYGVFAQADLINAIVRIQKRLGPLETKTAIGYLLEHNHQACFHILLTYYDKGYEKGLHQRNNLAQQLHKIPFETINISQITQYLIHEKALH